MRTMLRLLPALPMFLAPFLYAQRLPQTVVPEHYNLALTPDLKAATFSGKELIDVTLRVPSKAIVINSAEIKFQTVSAIVGGKTIAASVTPDEEKQQATLAFGQQIPAGKLRLSIDYTGILNNELRGFYLSKTAKRNYAVTQFESTDARRAFPSFDEPAFKATFDVTLVVDKDDTAISNTNIVHDVPQPGDKHAITFATTPRMSTYLLAFLVGDFKCLSGSSDGTPIRVCATPDQVQYGAFALKATEYTLHYYNTYFGIRYPMPKLDMIALPDFEAGAMENFGAITYRETDLLLDTEHASVGAQKEVALVVAHEMAHQWFGDMVTMQWWDNIWLNEGFATWMENKPVEAWKPEWFISQQVAADNQRTLDLDAQRVTRTIRAKAETPDEINEMFDGISYGKAGAVLLMVENYLGEETFRKGVHNYLAAHLFANATAEDFWSAQTATSHKPVDKIMSSLVIQPGEPLLTLGPANGTNLSVTQRRFFLNPGNTSDGKEVWTIPVCFKTGSIDDCEILSAPSRQLTIPATKFLFANAKGKGYYRTSYPAELYRAILPHVESDLTPEERISLLGDQWALTRSGSTSVGSYLDLVSAIRNDASANVINPAIGAISAISTRIAATPQERSQLAAWTRAQFAEPYANLGDPTPTDTPEKRELRAELFGAVVDIGEAPEAISQAKTLAARVLADPTAVDPTLAGAVIYAAARHGDAAFYDKLQDMSANSPNPQERSNSLHALALFRDPALVKRTLDYAVSGKVRNQDSIELIAIELQVLDTQETAWQYVQDNWDKVLAQTTTSSGGYLVGSTGAFCTLEKKTQVSAFFVAHKVPATERALARALDQISDCVALRAAQEPNLKAWLARQN